MASQRYRTGYHFQPLRNWMNDPNGPVYYKGLYHFFYQYNPAGPVFGYMAWGHSVSSDLVNWIHLDIALNPTDPYDVDGCWSGSITFLNGEDEEPVIMYTGGDSQKTQSQNLAVPKDPSDPLLREWTKSPHNPLIVPSDGIGLESFRDPTTAWRAPDGTWKMLVGAEIEGRGLAVLYKSKDFLKWDKADKDFYSSVKTGMLECPDFFPVGVQGNEKYVLKVSFHGRDYYVLGKYDPETDDFKGDTDFLDAGADLRYDYGKFYASKVFYDTAKKRWVLWGWVPESDTKSDNKKDWAGLQAVPRSVVLSSSGRQLVQWPVEEIKKLRGNKFSLQDRVLEGGSVIEITGITASQADVEVSFEMMGLEEAESLEPTCVDAESFCKEKDPSTSGTLGPFGLLVLASEDLAEQTAVFFRVFKRNEKYVVFMCSDESKSSSKDGLDNQINSAFVDLNPEPEKITLRTLIDRSIVESFGGEGKTCITSRVYPKKAVDDKARLFAFNNGTHSVKISQLNAWSMKSAKFTTKEDKDGCCSILKYSCF